MVWVINENENTLINLDSGVCIKANSHYYQGYYFVTVSSLHCDGGNSVPLCKYKDKSEVNKIINSIINSLSVRGESIERIRGGSNGN